MRICKRLLAPVLGLAFAGGLAHAQTAEIAASVIDQEGRPVADAVLIAVPVDGNMRPPQRPRDGSIDQVDKEFFPRVTIVPVGASVTFPNHDDVRHQVYSFSPAKRFELPLYAGVPAQPVVFDKPGVVVLGCNIHDWMVGYVYVSESPFFAKTGKDGKAMLAELPARAYVLRVWHPQLEMSEDATHKTIDVSRDRRVEAAWTVTLKREVRVRRAPTSERGGTKY
ncbi:MAG TPA: methylamine utilization protein [Casimicrobiaceae bacterium]|nr:methylamine utilization protein [Casimicrobiaceae bacterium]